jgi:hypothetical protein
VNPSSEHLDLLDENLEVCVPRKDPTKDGMPDDGGLYPIDVLDPSLYVPLHVVYYFHNLIWYLTKHNYSAGETLFGFGYDFRQSNTKHVDDLLARLEAASAANKGVKCGSCLIDMCFKAAAMQKQGKNRKLLPDYSLPTRCQ